MPLSRFQPEHYNTLLADKVAKTEALLAPFSPPAAAVFPSPRDAFRLRAEFRVWHQGDQLDYVMFHPDAPRDPVPVNHFPIAGPRIQALMAPLRERLTVSPLLRRKLFQVEFLTTTSGDALVTLVYHRPLEDDWQQAAEQLVADLGIALVGRSRKQKRVIGRDHVTESLEVEGRTWYWKQVEQGFTQPNGAVNREMLHWACRSAQGLGGDLLELYCGNGNFTLPLSRHFDTVIATELAKTSVRAAQHNLAQNAVSNVQLIRLAAEEVTQAIRGERAFRRLADLPQALGDYDLRTVFVDPPRAGLDPATEAMVQGFDNILYVSCNPQTLAGNLQRLTESHRIAAFALFDQFPYTDHMECGVLLQRR
ncbi:MAG: tRNA (uridine(54)-C5)-methyltransferase TrmA [Haliea sp.]|nr:tRNA (uridine(54)-C5)-methyltransferase TrmA [Haliea sp.]|tara:strand:+ start:84529 stop:85623 length:1095 start_codon:yes stop_codon:yes gene_type:complete